MLHVPYRSLYDFAECSVAAPPRDHIACAIAAEIGDAPGMTSRAFPEWLLMPRYHQPSYIRDPRKQPLL